LSRDFIGVQVGPASFIDEGVDAVLDILQEKAAVNSLVIAPLTWDASVAGRADGEAPGHGIPGPQDVIGGAFWRPDPAYYRQNLLREFRAPDRFSEGFDVLGDVIASAKPRELKVYPYLFETSFWDRPVGVVNFVQVVEIDCYGRKAARPCLRNPDYRAWLFSVIEDVSRNYDIAGILWGLERQGPLMTMLEEQTAPACFCKYCGETAQRLGIDVRRAREGYVEVDAYLRAVKNGLEPRDGYFVTFLRVLLRNPEIFQWEKMWSDGHKGFYKEIYGLVKFLDPEKEVGLGLWYRITTTNPFLRAQYDYAEFKGMCDWVKPILYHVPAGARFAKWIHELQGTIFKDASADAWASGLQQVLHHDEGPLEALPEAGFTPDYVRRETARLAAAFEGEARIYPAIGVGMSNPGGREIEPEDAGPAIEAAYAGGADGVLLCRMYAEISLRSLEAAGQTLRALGKA
jgi:hypothetical protein